MYRHEATAHPSISAYLKRLAMPAGFMLQKKHAVRALSWNVYVGVQRVELTLLYLVNHVHVGSRSVEMAGRASSISERPILFSLSSGRKWIAGCIFAGRYINILPNSVYDPKFDVDSDFGVGIVHITHNHELRAQMGNFGRQAQINSPDQPNQ